MLILFLQCLLVNHQLHLTSILPHEKSSTLHYAKKSKVLANCSAKKNLRPSASSSQAHFNCRLPEIDCARAGARMQKNEAGGKEFLRMTSWKKEVMHTMRKVADKWVAGFWIWSLYCKRKIIITHFTNCPNKFLCNNNFFFTHSTDWQLDVKPY